MKTKTLIIIATSLVLIGIFFLPFKVPYAINSVAKILPAHQWILSRGNDGEILTNTVNNINGINYSSRLFSFERGESIILDIDPSLKNGQLVQKGDTLGVIYSSRQQEDLIKLKGERDVLAATLKASTSGDKKTIVREAQERLEKAKSEFGKQSKIVERLKPLYEKEFIAESEYQLAFDELTVLSKAVNIRQAELESSLSGEKAEEIDMLKEQIAAIENEISFLHQQMDICNLIIAPFNSRIERSFSPDTLLVLSTIDSGIAIMPVSLERAAHVDIGENVSFHLNGIIDSLSGSVQMKQPAMQLVDGKQCIIVLATVNDLSSDFISGIITQAEINCGPVPLHTFIKRNILY